MVYDESRNYIGDTFQKDVPLEDGDELNLDRAGVLVQVGEKKATEQTDLTDLLAKRQPKALEKEKQPQARTTTQRLKKQSSNHQSSLLQSQPQRPWTGWAARAQIPTDSPHAVKQAATAMAQKENVTPDGPPRKKQRQDDEHIPLWRILKTSRPAHSQLIASSAISSCTRVGAPQTEPMTSATQQVSNSVGQAQITVEEVIDITGESSDKLEPIEDHANEPLPDVARYSPTHPLLRQPRYLSVERGQVLRVADQPDPGGVYNSPLKQPPLHPQSKVKEPSRVNHLPEPSTPARSWSAAERANVQPTSRDSFEGPLDTPDTDFAPQLDSLEAGPAHVVKAASKPLASIIGRQSAASASLKAMAPTKLVETVTVDVEPVVGLDVPPRSPPVSMTRRLSASVSLAVRPENDVSKEKEAVSKATKKQQTKPLRLSLAAPKRQLFCQTLTNVNDVSKTRSTPLATSEASTASNVARRIRSRKIATKNLSTTKLMNNTPQIVSIDDEDSQEVFEVMKTKKRRLEDARRNEETGSSAKVSSAKAGSTKTASAKRSSAKASSPKPTAKKFPVSNPSSANTTSTSGEGGLPSITNQVDQRPVTNSFKTAAANASPVVRTQRSRAFTSVGIEYGTTSLDAEFLSPLPLSAAAAPAIVSMNGNATKGSPHTDKHAQPPSNQRPVSGSTANIRLTTAHKRPLKRVTSDVSPIEKGLSSRVGLSRRAETMSVVQETRKQRDKAGTFREQMQDKDLGAWSKEAWDLFGGCPAGREGRPIWAYDVPDLAGCVDSGLSETGLEWRELDAQQ